MNQNSFLRLGGIRDVETFRNYLQQHHISIPCDVKLLAGDTSPLGLSLQRGGVALGNRFAIQPMEGWDGTTDGRPTELTFRRWRRFGASGAKLIWGGEAVAVRHEGRANPNQLLINEHTKAEIAQLRETLVAAHKEACGA